MESIRISKGRVIPVAFCVVGTFLLFFVYEFLYENVNEVMFIILGIVISPILPLMWTSRTIVEINPREKYIHKFVWLMGKKTGKPKSFGGIEKTYINAVTTSQRMTPRQKTTNTGGLKEYIGFLLLEDGRKIELIRDEDPDYVFEKMEKISHKLGTELSDNARQSNPT